MKKILILMFILGIFLLGSVSAWDFDNIKHFDKKIGKYGQIKIKNAFGLGKSIADYTLEDNTDQCLINCYAEGTATLYTKGKLFSDLRFKDRRNKFKNLKDSKILILIEESYQIDVPDYKEVCEYKYSFKNMTSYKNCKNVKVGSHKETKTKSYWKEYKGEVLNAGTYKWKIEAKKNPFESIDWIGSAFGKDLTDWAWWNSNWYNKRQISNLTGNISYLNISYDSDMQTDFDDLRFINSAEDTELNYTIQKKSDGNWAIVRVNNLGETSIYMYYGNPSASSGSSASNTYFNPVSMYYLDGTSGDVIDAVGNYDGTNSGATRGVTGKIDNAFELEAVANTNGDFVYNDSNLGISGFPYTFNAWIKTSSSQVAEPSIVSFSKSGTGNPFSTIGFLSNTKIAITTRDDGGTISRYTSSIDGNNGSWIMVTGVFTSSSHQELWVNGENIGNSTTSLGSVTLDQFYIGANGNDGDSDITTSNWVFNGTIDEVGVWNKALSKDEIKAIYNQTAPNYVLGSEEGLISVTLNSPIDTYNSTSQTITFNGTVLSSVGVANVSLILDGVYNETNSSGVDGDYIFTKTLPEGTHNWTYEACDTNGRCANATVRTLTIDTSPKINISSPIKDTNYSTSSIWFNATSSLNVDNWVINYNGTNITISDQPGTSLNKLLNIEEGVFNLTIYARNSVSGVWGLNNSVTNFIVDLTPPSINITYPIGVIDYHIKNTNLDLNWSVSDTHLDSCWYDYNGTNVSVNCNDNHTTINITDYNNRNVTFYANDTFGHLSSETKSWEYKIFQNDVTYSSSTYETKTETFKINLIANASLTSVKLIYNGTEYSTLPEGSVYSKTFDIPTTNVGNNSIRWEFTYGEETIYSNYYYQDVNSIIFTLCNATYNTPYINFTFKNEGDLTNTTGQFPLSQFTYWLGTGSVNKTYEYINNTNNSYYAFCFSPDDETLNVDMHIQYKNSESPQRVYDEQDAQLTSSTENKTLYLLENSDGIYAYFIVYDSNGNVLSGVSVSVTRIIDGENVLLGQGTTDDAGAVNFWINPDYAHTYTFVKSGYDSKVVSLTIGDSTPRIIQLGGGTAQPPISDYQKQIGITINPLETYLKNDTIYNFNYTITTGYWALDEFGFTLKYGNGTIIGSKSSTSSTGGTLSLDANTSNQTRIIMDYYYVINSTYINHTKVWQIYTKSPFGISQLFTRANTYISANMFGVLGDEGTDYFGKALISVLILVLVTGSMSYRYGLRGDVFALGIIFGLVLFLNGIGFIPNPDFLVGTNVNLGDFLVYITGVMIIGFIIKEERK